MSFWVLMAFRMDVSFWANCNLEALGIRLRILPLKQPGLIEGEDVGATDGVGTCWRGPLRVTWGERDAVEEFGSGGDIEPVLAGSSPDPGQRWGWGPWVFIFPSRRTWIVRRQTAQGANVILPGMAPVEEERLSGRRIIRTIRTGRRGERSADGCPGCRHRCLLVSSGGTIEAIETESLELIFRSVDRSAPPY